MSAFCSDKQILQEIINSLNYLAYLSNSILYNASISDFNIQSAHLSVSERLCLVCTSSLYDSTNQIKRHL